MSRALYGATAAIFAGFILGIGATALAARVGLVNPAPRVGIGVGGALVAAPLGSLPSSTEEVAANTWGTAQEAVPAELRVVATDLKFTPNVLTGKVGQKMSIILDNKGLIEHDIAFTGMKATGSNPELKVLAKPGATATLELTPTAIGRYDFVCTIPGHKEAGMKGTMTVAN
ncbi:MAG: cupredoxin domain-containing protein [Chloroflexota bacterium]